MKNYTIIPNELSSIYPLRDLYTLTVMYLTANSNYTTDVTTKQLSEKTKLSKAYIKDYFLPRLKESKYIMINSTQEGYMIRRNTYHLPKPNKNFRIVSSEIINDENLEPDEKGFILALYTISRNTEPSCGFTDTEIIKRINLSKASYYRYKKRLIQKGYICSLNGRSKDYSFSSGIVLTCDWLGETDN